MMTLTSSDHYDVVIVGAGMVGASLALALQGQQHAPRILLIEASLIHHETAAEQPGFDARSTVLAEGTVRYFNQLGLWQSIAPSAQPIKHIHVSDQGRFGSVRMHSTDEDVDALGHVVENANLGQALNAALLASADLEVCSPATVTHLHPAASGMQLSIQSAGNTADITASLLVLAEGGRSGLCAELGISHRNNSYEQSAVIANVALSQSHQQIAYERFTPNGPLALLPLPDRDRLHRAALVWTHLRRWRNR